MNKKSVHPRRCLISVADKTGIADFARHLVHLGLEVVSTDGTGRYLASAGVPVREVSSLTQFPEIMGGRVKTLHPLISGGILADRANEQHAREVTEHGIPLIDMVVVNLYPFQQVRDSGATDLEIVENIDIGGPTMLRAAAKNFQHVVAVTDPADYPAVLEELVGSGGVSLATRQVLAQKVFTLMARYDEGVADYFQSQSELHLPLRKVQDLRYGENPHQSAALYRDEVIQGSSMITAEKLHGKELSYNNILDADAALRLILEFSEPAAAVIKHNNPCGCAVAPDIDQAFEMGYQADAQSAFGGVVILNRPCTPGIARKIAGVFMEIVIAPDFSGEALEILKKRKDIRLLRLGDIKNSRGEKEYRRIAGGFLQQDRDDREVTRGDLRFITDRKPSEKMVDDLLFAWKVVKHVRSNAIVFAKDGATIGIGAGQMSRVDSVDIAIKKAGLKTPGCVVASDAFFPFRDSIDALAHVGARAIIEPGGSIKDKEVVAAANEHGLALVFTGVRAFKH